MKKNLKVIIPILLVVILSFGIFIHINKSNKLKSEIPDTEKKSFYIDNKDKNKDGLPDADEITKDINGVIKKGDLEIYNPNNEWYFPTDIAITDKIVPQKNSINEDDLENYLKFILAEIGPNSYKEFNKNNIDNLMLMVSFPYSRTDKETVKKLAKMYFDVDNYTFPIGTYHTNYFGDIDVLEIDDLYVSRFDIKFTCPCFKYKSHELNENELVVQFNYLDYKEHNKDDYITLGTPYEVIGTSYIYLKFNGDNLNLKKVEYIPN